MNYYTWNYSHSLCCILVNIAMYRLSHTSALDVLTVTRCECMYDNYNVDVIINTKKLGSKKAYRWRKDFEGVRNVYIYINYIYIWIYVKNIYTARASIKKTWDSKCLVLIAQVIKAFGLNTKVMGSSPPQVETFSVSKTLALSQEHPFVCWKWMLLPAHS